MTHDPLKRLEGSQVDIAPWTYLWRADRAVQEKPEACFIPRRLERIDRVYRTAHDELPRKDLKSLYYNLPELLEPLLPAPTGMLATGLLWVGGLVDYQVELRWPEGRPVPAPHAVEVRDFPTAFGWFGWAVDRVLAGPAISADGRTWTYRRDASGTMESAYNVRLPAATEMVAVFCDTADAQPPVPDVRIVSPEAGEWRRVGIEIEWGFEARRRTGSFDARLEASVAVVGAVTPLAGDGGTTVAGLGWQSRATGGERRGVRVSLLYAPDSRVGLDSRVTVWTTRAGFTFRVSDVEKGPVYIPEHGVIVTKAGSRQTGRQFLSDLAAAKRTRKNVREMTREHEEARSWDELMQQVRLWSCPDGTEVPPFPRVHDPAMKVEVSDSRWTDAWRAATMQLRGEHMWGGLAFEVGRVAYDMELVGLHAEADKVYQHFLKAPGAKSDGDFVDGKGALEWASSMRHDMGYSHDGTHASTGRLLFAMAERYFLTGDTEWFANNRARLQTAADWIVRQRTRYMKDVPNRKDLHVAGLMPPQMLGDYVLPSCDWRWYYIANALDLQGLQRFADALADVDPEAGRKYQRKAAAFRRDLLRAVRREVALSPVRPGRDRMYHSYLPRAAYMRGQTGPELAAPEFPDTDLFAGALAVAEPYAVLDANTTCVVDTMTVLEELGMSGEAAKKAETQRREKGLPTDDAWFWHCPIILPKASLNADIYLRQDDIPNFLRFWGNAYAQVVGADGKLWEHTHMGGYTVCEYPDNGTAGWFLENFRDMLVMEENQSLWIARGTPRSWLEQGKRIAVSDAPTHLGTFAYEITSDVANGAIGVTIQVPARRPLESIVLRLRHPTAKRLRSVTVGGRPWLHFDPRKETITLSGLTGTVQVEARY